jgi:hypothetical protein
MAQHVSAYLTENVNIPAFFLVYLEKIEVS